MKEIILILTLIVLTSCNTDVSRCWGACHAGGHSMMSYSETKDGNRQCSCFPDKINPP